MYETTLIYSVFLSRNLILKDFRLEYLGPLLDNLWCSGIFLRRLDLHYLAASPGVSISDLDVSCPSLEELTICDSLVGWSTTFISERKFESGGELAFCTRHQTRPCNRQSHFKRLKSCSLYRVHYQSQVEWERVVRLAPNLQFLHLESSRGMTDTAIQSLLLDGYLQHLEVSFKVGK